MRYRKIWKPGGHPRRGMGSMKPGRRQLQPLKPRGTVLCKVVKGCDRPAAQTA